MRRAALLCLLPILAAAPLAAQAFEGVVTLKMPTGGTRVGDAKYIIKGDKMVTVMTMGAGTGPMAGKEMRVITDRTTMMGTMLIPMEMAGMKGIKVVVDLKATAAKADRTGVITSLGTTESIAGYKCENMTISDGKTTTTICMSNQLGTFTFPSSGGMGGGSATPGWATAMANHPGFPLRVTGSDGKVILEVTAVHPGRVSAEEFVIPEGYSSMPGMGGRRGGGGN